MRFLRLTQGMIALVDDADYERVNKFNWYALKTPSGNFYAARTSGKRPNRRTIYLHGEILGIKGVDHKDGDGLDCTRSNLRPATPKQQQQGFQRKRSGTSRFRGVSWCKRDSKWSVELKIDDKRLRLGRFESEFEAALVYDVAAKEAFGDFASLNFP